MNYDFITYDFVIALCLVFCIGGVGLGAYALHLSISTRIQIAAFEKSTHNIQYVPIDPKTPFDEEEDGDDDVNKRLKRSDDDAWNALEDTDELTQRGTTPLA